MKSLEIHVEGSAAPQGSKDAFRHRTTGRVVVMESSKAVKPWRARVEAAAREARRVAGHETFQGPVYVEAVFSFARPKRHYRTGRFAGYLRDNAPAYVGTKPDLDKVLRSTFDALTTAQVWRDDALVAEVTATKLYADDYPPCMDLVIGRIGQTGPSDA